MKYKTFRNVIVTIFLLLGLTLSLCGCTYYRYDFKDLAQGNIRLIEFYNLSGAEYRDSQAILETEPYYIMPEEDKERFLEQLRQIRFEDAVPLFIPSDPSFEYGFYVVRFQFEDGSYKFLSSGGYNEMFDSEGKLIDSDHYSCDDEQWIKLIHSFAGEDTSRIYYHHSIWVVPVEDHLRLHEIFAEATKLSGNPGCSFPSDDYITFGGKKYYLAEENQPVVQIDHEYYEVTEQAKQELYDIMIKNIDYWRYGEIDG